MAETQGMADLLRHYGKVVKAPAEISIPDCRIPGLCKVLPGHPTGNGMDTYMVKESAAEPRVPPGPLVKPSAARLPVPILMISAAGANVSITKTSLPPVAADQAPRAAVAFAI